MFTVPPLFTIPFIAPVVAVNENIPAVGLPSWLLLILIAIPVEPAFEIAVKTPEETTEKPCNVLLLIETVVVAVPALLIIPVIVPVEAMENVRAPPFELPSWLPVIFIAEVALPVLDMPVKAPEPAVFRWLLTMLELILIVAGADVLDMQVKAPVPVWVPVLIPFPLIFSIPVLPEFLIPENTDAPEEKTEQF